MISFLFKQLCVLNRLRILWTLLLLIVFTAGFAQNKEVFKVAMLLDIETEETLGYLDELKLEIRAVVGEDALVEFPQEYQMVHNFDVNLARTNYEKLVNSDADIVLAFGTSASLVMQQQVNFTKPTILLGSLSKDLSEADLEISTSGVPNFTYLTGIQSFGSDLKVLSELSSFKKVGIAIETGIVENVDLKPTFDPILKEIGAEYIIIPFIDLEDIAEGIIDIDALYLAGGFFLTDEQITGLSQILIENEIPSFTNSSVNDVELGLMGTNNGNDDITQIFRRLALSVEAFVNGQPLEEMNVFIDAEPRLTVNYNTMQRLDLPIKYSLIAQTDFVGKYVKYVRSKEVKSYSLLDLIGETLEKNLVLISNDLGVTLTEQDIKTAKSNYYPVLTANASFLNVDENVAFAPIQPEFSFDGNLNLNQTIYSEAASANITVQKNLNKAQEANFKASQFDAILESANLYFNALISKVNVRIQSQNLQLTKENLRIATQNFEAGQAGKSDMLRFQSQLAQNTQAFIEAVNQLDQSFFQINQLRNAPVMEQIDVNQAQIGVGVFETYNYDGLAEILDNPQLKEPFVAFLIEEAKNNSPELESLAYNIKAVDRTIDLKSYGRFVPTLSLQANYNYNFNQWGVGSTELDPAGNYNVGVNLSVPILDGFRNNIDKKTAEIQKEQLEVNTANTELAIETNISTGVLNLVNQIANIRLAEVSVAAAQESLDLVQTSYSEGAVSIIQLIDAQNNFLQSQLAQASATYNFLLTAIQLERFIAYNFLLHTEEENNAFEQRFLEFLNNND